jgi:hypothetical protein
MYFYPSYTAAATGQMLMWGFQLELGSRASSPILTLGATATRAADQMLAPAGGRLSSTAGTVVADGITSSIGAAGFVSLNDGTGNNRVDLRSGAASFVSVGGVTQAEVTLAETVAGQLTRSAFAYAINNFAASRNGGAVATDVSGTVPAVTQMQLGGIDGGTANQLSGHLTRIRYIGRRLTNAQLQALTA